MNTNDENSNQKCYSTDNTILIQLPKLKEPIDSELPKLKKLDETVKLPKLKCEDGVTLPKFNQDIINHYSKKIDDLENTQILDLKSLKVIEFKSKINDEEIKNAKEISVDKSDLEKTVLIKIPSLTSKKKKYLQIEKHVLNILIIFMAIGIFVTSLNLGTYLKSYHDSDKIIDNISENIKTNPGKKEDEYKYIKQDNIDFDKLKEQNNEFEGWISVDKTKINYPFVRGSDNDFYLNHSFDKSKNVVGWVFLDYRNSIDNLSSNNILYAHNSKNGSMFGTLKNLLNKKGDYTITISTKKTKYTFKVFSVYTIPETTDYLLTDFESEEDYKNFLDLITNRSKFNFDNKPNINNKIITLSTCHGKNSRAVVHAKLFKTENNI